MHTSPKKEMRKLLPILKSKYKSIYKTLKLKYASTVMNGKNSLQA